VFWLVTYKLAENELRYRVVGIPDGSKPSANMYSKMPDWKDSLELRVNGMVTPQGQCWGRVEKLAVPLREDFRQRRAHIKNIFLAATDF
jgi:hypothetical protein